MGPLLTGPRFMTKPKLNRSTSEASQREMTTDVDYKLAQTGF